jgi:hypothetical protein
MHFPFEFLAIFQVDWRENQDYPVKKWVMKGKTVSNGG